MVATSNRLNIFRLPLLRNFSPRIKVPELENRARLNQKVRGISNWLDEKWKEYTAYMTIRETKKIDSELMKKSISMRDGVISNPFFAVSTTAVAVCRTCWPAGSAGGDSIVRACPLGGSTT